MLEAKLRKPVEASPALLCPLWYLTDRASCCGQWAPATRPASFHDVHHDAPLAQQPHVADVLRSHVLLSPCTHFPVGRGGHADHFVVILDVLLWRQRGRAEATRGSCVMRKLPIANCCQHPLEFALRTSHCIGRVHDAKRSFALTWYPKIRRVEMGSPNLAAQLRQVAIMECAVSELATSPPH